MGMMILEWYEGNDNDNDWRMSWLLLMTLEDLQKENYRLRVAN